MISKLSFFSMSICVGPPDLDELFKLDTILSCVMF